MYSDPINSDMRVRTVHGGTHKMNKAVRRWRPGMQNRDLMKLEQRGGK